MAVFLFVVLSDGRGSVFVPVSIAVLVEVDHMLLRFLWMALFAWLVIGFRQPQGVAEQWQADLLITAISSAPVSFGRSR